MADVTSASPVAVVQTAAKAEVAAVESKVVTFVKANASKVISAAVGFGVAKLGLLGLIWKLI